MFPLLAQPMVGGKDDALLFPGGNAGCRPAMAGAAAQAHFDEDQGFALGTDEINLAAPYPVIAVNDRQSPAPQEAGRQFLRGYTGIGAGRIITLAPGGQGPENAADE